ncbi:MAG: hypothetical protein J6W81_05350 [Lentisphaeria bacterium]|nr:hypothetical protein [Lentisphaeria bacterium]
MDMKRFFSFAAVTLLICGIMLPLSAAVKINKTKIIYGTSFRMHQSQWNILEFELQNPDPKPHTVMFRVRSAEGYTANLNASSPSVTIPAYSTALYRVPVYTEASEKYAFDIFEDGVRRPYSSLHESSIKLLGIRQELVGQLNDDSDAIGGLNDHPLFKDKLFPVSFRASSVPTQKELFQNLRLLIVNDPDFSNYTSAQFSAIIEYAAAGGTVIFLNPKGILAAADTPLNILLPVIPLQIRKISGLSIKGSLLNGHKVLPMNRQEIEFLDSLEKTGNGVTLATHDGFPFYRESRFGLGRVIFLAVSPDRGKLLFDTALSQKLMARILLSNGAETASYTFNDPLDKLTGFAVPRLKVVLYLLIFYFALLLVALFIGFYFRKAGVAWFSCSVIAILMTAGILWHVKKALGDRSSLAAVIKIRNAALPEHTNTYVSLYAAQTGKENIQASGTRNRLESIPIPRYKSIATGAFNIKSLLDIRTLANGTPVIHEMNLAARSSKQFTESANPEKAVSVLADYPVPEIRIEKDGMTLAPWKIPAGLEAEAAFLLCPGGSRQISVDSDGKCTLQETENVMTDPMQMALRQALEKSHNKTQLAVVVISPVDKNHPVWKGEFQVQGKTLTLFPADMRITDQNITLPHELLTFSPSETSSRLLLIGNQLNPAHAIQQDFTAKLIAALPPVLYGFQPDNVMVTVSTTNTDHITPIPKLQMPDGTVIFGKPVGSGRFAFEGKSLQTFFHSGTNTGLLHLEGRLKKERNLSNTEFAFITWNVLKLNLQLQGKVPAELVNKKL